MAHAQNPWTPQRFGDKFLRQSWGWTEYVTFFWLVGSEVTGWCYRNLVLSLKLSSFILHLGGGLSSCRTTQRYCIIYIYKDMDPWGRNQRPALLLQETIVSWLSLLYFRILSLFWLATVWIWLWTSGKVKETEWSPFPTNKKWETWKEFVAWRTPTGSCFVSVLPSLPHHSYPAGGSGPPARV